MPPVSRTGTTYTARTCSTQPCWIAIRRCWLVARMSPSSPAPAAVPASREPTSVPGCAATVSATIASRTSAGSAPAGTRSAETATLGWNGSWRVAGSTRASMPGAAWATYPSGTSRVNRGAAGSSGPGQCTVDSAAVSIVVSSRASSPGAGGNGGARPDRAEAAGGPAALRPEDFAGGVQPLGGLAVPAAGELADVDVDVPVHLAAVAPCHAPAAAHPQVPVVVRHAVAAGDAGTGLQPAFHAGADQVVADADPAGDLRTGERVDPGVGADDGVAVLAVHAGEGVTLGPGLHRELLLGVKADTTPEVEALLRGSL